MVVRGERERERGKGEGEGRGRGEEGREGERGGRERVYEGILGLAAAFLDDWWLQ